MEASILDLYSDLVRVQGLLPKPDDKLNEAVETLKLSIGSEVTEHLQKEYYKGLSTGLYELCDKIRSIVDEVKQFGDNKNVTHGISMSSKIKVILLGETSAGKTTFLQRIFGENCGQTGSDPITAFAVIHTSENLQRPRLDVKFKKEFTIKEKDVENFDKFLKSNELQYKFDSVKNHYVRNDEDFCIENSDKFPAFIKEANNYPEAFDEIVWHHKKTSGQSKFADFADLYDMPGSGGADEHTDNLKIAIEKYDADIVLYLIKSDQGTSSDYSYLKDLQKQIEGRKFYFVYQKPNNDLFEDKVATLKEFINKDENSDALNPFNEHERLFFQNTQVVDVRGPQTDKVIPNIALAVILQNYYLCKAQYFFDALNMQKNEPKEFQILKAKLGEDGVNGHLRNFLEEVNSNCNGINGLPTYANIKKKFEERFCLNGIDNNYDGDLRTTLISFYDRITNMLSKVLDSCCKGGGIGGIMGETTFSPTKYVQDFKKSYTSDINYQQLIYLIQSYHFLRLTYKGELEEIYAKKAINPILKNLSEYINRLKSIENRISVIRNLTED